MANKLTPKFHNNNKYSTSINSTSNRYQRIYLSKSSFLLLNFNNNLEGLWLRKISLLTQCLKECFSNSKSIFLKQLIFNRRRKVSKTNKMNLFNSRIILSNLRRIISNSTILKRVFSIV